MPVAIKMPKLSDTMVEGVLVAWKKRPGEAVKAGDHIGEVETDKAVMPIEVFDEGVLAKQVIAEGQTVPVGGVIALLAGKGEDWKTVSASDASAAAPASGAAKAAAGGASAPAATGTAVATATPASSERVKASPLARKVAAQAGIDLAALAGTGPNGRIVQQDVQAAIASRGAGKAAPAPAAEPAAKPAPVVPARAPASREDTVVSVAGTRGTIAKRLVESKTTIPHFYCEMDVNAEKLSAARAALKAALPDQKITVNDFILRACAICLRKHPAVNASWRGDKIIQLGHVNIGVGVAVDGGLLVPVLRDADTLSIGQIGAEMRALAAAAKARTLTPAQMTGGSFTISNMGMLGVTRFQAIINPPEAAILAVGGIREEPVVKNGQVVPGQRMSLTLSVDHRVIDGANAAAFLADVRALLEEPLTMLV